MMVEIEKINKLEGDKKISIWRLNWKELKH